MYMRVFLQILATECQKEVKQKGDTGKRGRKKEGKGVNMRCAFMFLF
jgi:hypothetical protein